MHRNGKTWIIILGLLATGFAGTSALPAAAQDDVTWLLNQINTLRAGLGLHPYALNPQLSAAATVHSRYMADTCDVTHFWADGTRAADRARAQGYPGGWISENIYGGRNASASRAWGFWTTSPIHYQGLTHKIVNEIGIGVVESSCGRFYTLVFGQRDDAPQAPAPQQAEPPQASANFAPPPANDPPPATAIPYVPPTATFTPTPTVPTLTPSATWTITPSHTPSLTATVPPPTSTALVLPTVPALTATDTPEPVIVAAVPSATLESTAAPPGDADSNPRPADLRGSATSEGRIAVSLSDLIPVLLLGQVILIALAGFVVFRRAQ